MNFFFLRRACWTVLYTVFFVLCATVGFSSDVSLAAEAEKNGDSLDSIWVSREGELQEMFTEADLLQQRAEDLAKPLGEMLPSVRTRFTRLTGLYHASQGHPTEQLTVVQQMHSLFEGLVAAIVPLEEIAETINRRLEETGRLQQELKNIAAGDSGLRFKSDSMDAGAVAMRQYTQSADAVRAKLRAASTRLTNILAPAKDARDRIAQSVNNVEGSLVQNWATYYLTTSGTRFGDLASTPALLMDWGKSLNSRMSFAYPHSVDEWLNAFKNFMATALVMAFIGFSLLRGARSLPKSWSRALEHILRTSWIWVALGVCVLMASGNQHGGIYFVLLLLSALLLIGGIGSLSWRLRVTVDERLENKSSPLKRLFPPAAIGVIMLFSDLPTRILGVMWGLVIVAFLVHVALVSKRQCSANTPLLERVSIAVSVIFAIVSLLIVMVGYARMAILEFMLVFALVNMITLGSALMGLFSTLAEQLFGKQMHPIANAVVQATSVPVAWVVSLACAIPWLWAVPGAQYLLRHLMSTNYTIGEASFDFSRIIFIVLLYFLFRSFVTLGSTYLEHLPQRMPQLERGVIPPLRSMIFYGLWTIFVLIVLALLGVNFTSLAVVAGGLSVGIGFGMQNLFNNLVSGIMLLFGRTILVGDNVDVGGASGTVTSISIRSTTILTGDRATVYVPNSAIMAGQFTNWTRKGRMVRKQITVGVAYDTDVAKVEKLLLQIAAKQPHVLSNPAPAVYFMAFGDSALQFSMDVFVDDISFGLSTQSAIRFEIHRLFKENNIDMPFPQLDLHMPNGSSLLKSSASGSSEPEVDEIRKESDQKPHSNQSIFA